MEVRYGWDTFAKNRGDYIYLHEGLKEFPRLHDSLLAHERGHGGKPLREVLHELKSVRLVDWDYLKFFMRYPGAFFWCVSPVSFGHGVNGLIVFYSWFRIVVWLWMLACLLALSYVRMRGGL